MDLSKKIETINKLIKEINSENMRVRAINKYLKLEDIESVELSERVLK